MKTTRHTVTKPISASAPDMEPIGADVEGYTIFRANFDRDEPVVVKIPPPDPVLWVPGSYRKGVWHV